MRISKICNKNYSSKNKLKRHIDTNLHKNNLENYIIIKNLNDEEKVNININLQQKSKYNCEICGISCGDSSALKIHYETQYHMKNLQELNDPDIKCVVPSVKRNNVLDFSPKDENGKFILKCQICNETYSDIYHLNIHYNTILHKNNIEKQLLLEKAKLSNDEVFLIELKNKKGEVVGSTKVDKDIYVQIIKYSFCLDEGYARISVDSKSYKLSRYIYYNLQGKENNPDKKVDHFNNDKLDNRLINLREADDSQNGRNKIKSINATSKYHGVSYDRGKWVCTQRYNGKHHNFRYDDELHAAYHHDLLIKQFKLQDFNKLNNIENPINFILKESFKRKYDLPKGVYSYGNTGKFSIYHSEKTFYGFNTIEEALICRTSKIKDQEIKKIKDILSKPIIRNESGLAIIEIFNKKKEKVATTIVDDDNIYYTLKSHKINFNGKYASILVGKKKWSLSRFIMNYSGKKYVDHTDSNKLNNQKSNLRILDAKGNGQNKSSAKNSSSKFVGVSYITKDKKWSAYITIDDKTKSLGRYNTEHEAVLIRDKKAEELNSLGAYFKINLTDII